MKITDKIHQLRIDFEITLSPDRKIPRFVNVLIIFGDKISLVDTGVSGSEQKIFDYIRRNGRDPSEIETVIISHSHPDHIGSAARIKESTGCRVLAHMAEREWIENIDIQNRERPVPGFYSLVKRSVKPDDFLSDNQDLKLADNLTAKIIHSPGHSRGSLNILFMEERILFTADSIPLKNDIPNYDNYLQLLKSLETIESDTRYEILLSSWTPPLTDKKAIDKIISEGREYILKLDKTVVETYTDTENISLDFCKSAIEKLGMPDFLVNPVVDKAFRSHLN